MTSFTYTPVSNITVIAECWAGGGIGLMSAFFDVNTRIPGPGGGGAAYARKAGIALTGGVGYTVVVAVETGTAGDHESSFVSNLVVKAVNGGNASPVPLPGLGGDAALCVGDVTLSGGDGAPVSGPFNVPQTGSGGGSSAGRAGAGTPGAVPLGGVTVGGGNGGDGGPIGGPGVKGFDPGGGGGGGGINMANELQGNGGGGAVVLWEDLGVWPPYGQVPLASFGSPPPLPVNPLKSKKGAFVM